ncbi:MAG TPA: citrate/2-methylcitrate synthase [Methylomirabilota bacterium]|nr:citrate/2-methylcitrate synthase [Methylomirabilota bacterium]
MTVLPTLSPGYNWRADELEWPVTTDVGRGLSGVVATATGVMWLDPASGTLSYRGCPVEALAGERGFEEVAYLLIAGVLPEEAPDAFASFRDGLRTSRGVPGEVLALLGDLDPHTHPTRLLRAGVSALGCHELPVTDDLSGERHWRELRIVGQVAGLVGAIAAHRAGRPPGGPPDSSASLSRGLLAALTGREPDPEDVRILDLLWVLYAAHGLDAPTFASMVVASCLADPYFNVVAGLSALRGPRQGGATEAVLEQLGRLERPEDAVRLVDGILAGGGAVAGFGHRAYRMPDPRVVVLRRELAALARRRGRDELFARARALETAATAALAGRGVHVNINFYAAPIFALLGADPALVPCLYAVARTAGILALVREAMETIRLVRPLTRYVGPAERRVSPGGPG